MTDQEAFDIMVRHLAGMTHKSVDPAHEDFCMYRAPDGNKCVVGALIQDSEYAPTMENWDAAYLAGKRGVGSLAGLSAVLLRHMQETHDDGLWSDGGFADWGAVQGIASAYGLSDAVVDEVLA